MLDNGQNSAEVHDSTQPMYNGTSGSKKVFSLMGMILVLGSILTYVLFVRSIWSDYSVVSADVTSRETQIGDLKSKIASVKETESKMDLGTEVQKMTLINSIPVGVNQGGVIEDLVKIAGANDVELKSVSFGLSSASEKEVGSLKINASFEGNYRDLINFLQGIEENARFFKVTSINVQVSDLADLDVKRVVFSLSIDAFYQQ